jgi:hypothetical protein
MKKRVFWKKFWRWNVEDHDQQVRTLETKQVLSPHEKVFNENSIQIVKSESHSWRKLHKIKKRTFCDIFFSAIYTLLTHFSLFEPRNETAKVFFSANP